MHGVQGATSHLADAARQAANRADLHTVEWNAPTGREIVENHTMGRGRHVDIDAVAQTLKAEVQARPQEAAVLLKEALDHLPVDDRGELAEAFMEAHQDAELQALGQTDAGRGALALAVGELTQGDIYGGEAEQANRAGTALGLDLKVEGNAGWAGFSAWVHGGLDAAGFFPGLGAIPDLVNAGIYALEGDWANAGLSTVAAVPAVGDGIKGGTLVVKAGSAALEHGDEAVDAARVIARADELPEGLAYRADLPQHLAGPHGFKGQKLHGTHNADNAIAELQGRGIPYRVEPTSTPGISELKYDVTRPDGSVVTNSKTIYDPAVFSDARMLELAQRAGERAFVEFMKDPANASNFYDFVEDGVKLRAYINKLPDGTPYVGNVHPIP
jgi:hypothetical protein